MSFNILVRALGELEQVMNDCGVKLILGGGFGLFLWQIDEQESGAATLITREAWCVPRATLDLDIFLETIIVASIDQFQAIQQSLDHLDYKVIPGVEYLHFEKHYSETERVEINFLTGPITDSSLAAKIKISRPRARPKGADVKLHAYLTDEAMGISERLQRIRIKKVDSSIASNLYVPSPATFLLMKIHAFRDRLAKGDIEKSGHHAMDIYRTISMLTEKTYGETVAFLQMNRDNNVLKSAASIVRSDFTALDQPGMTKIREHSLYRNDFDLEKMRSVLTEVFAKQPYTSS
jgi:hypothetical protein